MKTIYSILSIPLNTALDERLSVGIVMSNGTDHYFKYSLDKLNAVKGIINSDKLLLAKNYLRTLEKEVNFEDSTTFFDKELADQSGWINEQYLSYLSRYSNNTIQFSAPKYIDIDFTIPNFKKIFEKYVFKFDDVLKHEVRHINLLSKVQIDLYPVIEDKVNIDITLTSNDFENLFVPIEVNFLGLNGAPVAGQTFDFTKKHYSLENEIAKYISLSKALDLEGNNYGKYFVLGTEPDKIYDKSHKLWEQIRDTHFLEFVDLDEIERIESYINDKGVRPYFEKN